MKITRKIPSVILAVVLLTVLAVFSVSAAVDVNSIEGNTVEVRSWVQLDNALTKAPIGGNPLRNSNRYIVLNAHLTMTSENSDVGIKVNYPGTIYLDLNGYSIEVNSSATQNLFTIDGTQKTVFIIADTATDKTKQSSITFNSTKNESAVVYVNNPNASFRIFGKGDFKEEKIHNNFLTRRLPSTNIFVNKASNFQTDTKPHAAIRADKIDVLTINETFFGNYSKNPVNLYIGECNKVKITDETIFKLSGKSLVKSPTYANIYLASITKHPSEYFNMEGGWVFAGESVKSILTKNKTFHPHFYDIIGEKSTSTAIPYKKGVCEFSVKYVQGEGDAISLNRWQGYIDESKVLFVNAYCCNYNENAEAKVERTSEIHHFGHMSFCANCSRLISITPHNTKTRTAVGYAPTCTEPGMKDKYKCKNCNLFRGGAEIPARGHDMIVDVAAKAPTCTEAGSTEGSHCSRCDHKVEATVIPALGHTDADNDGKCDRCGGKADEPVNPQPDPSANCNHICHKSGISAFFYRIARFFWKLFKTHKYCSCGAAHY